MNDKIFCPICLTCRGYIGWFFETYFPIVKHDCSPGGITRGKDNG